MEPAAANRTDAEIAELMAIESMTTTGIHHPRTPARPASRPPASRPASHDRHDGRGKWDNGEREKVVEDITSTLAGQFRITMEELEAERAKMRQREEIEAEIAAEKKKRDGDAWEQRVAEQKFNADEAQTKQAKIRGRIVNGLLIALTTAVTGFGTYLTTRAAPTTPEFQKATVAAEVAKEEAVKTAAKATVVDQRQDHKLQQLGLAQTDQIVLEVDTTDYNSAMLKAISSRAAAVPEPDSLAPARTKAAEIKRKKKIASRSGKSYDPFEDLPDD